MAVKARWLPHMDEHERQVVKSLRFWFGRAMQDYHAQSVQHGNKAHSGRSWLNCQAVRCQDGHSVWKRSEPIVNGVEK